MRRDEKDPYFLSIAASLEIAPARSSGSSALVPTTTTTTLAFLAFDADFTASKAEHETCQLEESPTTFDLHACNYCRACKTPGRSWLLELEGQGPGGDNENLQKYLQPLARRAMHTIHKNFQVLRNKEEYVAQTSLPWFVNGLEERISTFLVGEQQQLASAFYALQTNLPTVYLFLRIRRFYSFVTVQVVRHESKDCDCRSSTVSRLFAVCWLWQL